MNQGMENTDLIAVSRLGIGHPYRPTHQEMEEEYFAMKEAELVRKIMLAVRKKYPMAYVRKLADRFTRGVPDLLVVVQLTSPLSAPDGSGIRSAPVWTGILFIEVKQENGKTSKIQDKEHREIQQAGGEVLVARDVETVLAKLEEMGAI